MSRRDVDVALGVDVPDAIQRYPIQMQFRRWNGFPSALLNLNCNPILWF
jgi:hypothetical protein